MCAGVVEGTVHNVAMPSFEELNARGQVARIRRAIVEAMAPEKVVSCRIISHQHNSTFKLVTEGGASWFLRVSRVADRRALALEDELRWISELATSGHSVARPIRWFDGAFFRPLTGDLGSERFLTRFEWREGKAKSRPSLNEWREIGRAMAHLHEFTLGREDLGRNRWKVDGLSANNPDIEMSLREVARALGSEAELAIRKAGARYEQLKPSLGDEQLIHGDLHQWNVLFNPNDGMTMIDFDDCGRAPIHYDFVVPIREMVADRLAGAQEALFGGYQEIRQLPEGLHEAMPVLLGLRTAQLVNWVVGERSNPTFATWWESWARKELESLQK